MKKLLLFAALTLGLNSFGQIVNIPDANFKASLVGDPAINTNLDAEIQVSEANVFTGGIWCANMNISDLTGIEEFTALTELYCFLNQLTSLDVSQNTALTLLQCHMNQLTSLDVSQNTALTELDCRWNQLTSLDMSQNTALTELSCHSNQLTSLDVSQNTALFSLVCDFNQLTSLDASQNSALIWLSCTNNELTCLNFKNGNNFAVNSFDATDNPNLTCIEVDDVAYSNSNWTNIDPQTSFSTNCNNACSGSLGIDELYPQPKELIKIVDLMGRETKPVSNTPLIYYYSNGTIERVFKLEE